MPDIIDKLLNTGEIHARKILLELHHKELVPFYHLVSGTGEPDVIIQCHFANDLQKQIAFLTAKNKAKEMKAIAGMFIAESWMISIPADEVRTIDIQPRPSHHPDRIEVVMMVATTGLETRSRMLRIVRDKPEGKITTLITEKDSPADNLSGRMIDGLILQTQH
jgi:hypothetical protein